MITSKVNVKARWVRTLQGRARERKEQGAFVAEGVRLVEEAVRANWRLRLLLYADGLSDRGMELVEGQAAGGVDVQQASPELLHWLSDTETSQGLLAVVDQRTLPLPSQRDFLLIADQIRDPGNLGALLRSAEAAGVQAALIPPASTDPFSPKAVRAAMGAHFRLPIRSCGWSEIDTMVRGLDVLLADMGGRSAWDTDLRRPLALIVGGEAEGASAEARALAAERVGIPMRSTTESLNAAVAGSILLFEVARQRTGRARSEAAE